MIAVKHEVLSWLRNIRFYVLVLSISLSILEYYYIQRTVVPALRELTLTQTYALTGVVFLYLALYAGPLTKLFTSLPFRARYLKARRALGVSAFGFAALHARRAFFDVLGGFSVLPQLSPKVLFAIILSTVALIILSLMAATSFDFMVRRLTFPKWKRLHQFVYIAGIFIAIHATLIGSHFQNLSGIIPLLFYGAFFLLVVLHIAVHMKFRKP